MFLYLYRHCAEQGDNLLKTKMILAIAIAAGVVVAGVGIGWMLLQDDGPDEGTSFSGSLEVLGNANGDGKIDLDDINVIQDIIDGKKSFADHPLADANNDGTVDNADIEKVQAILDATASSKEKIWVINHTTDARETYITGVMYPITAAVATGSANSLLNFKYLGIHTELKGLSFGGTKPDTTLFYEFSTLLNGANLGVIPGGTTSANNMHLESVAALKVSQGVSAVITADNKGYVENETDLNGIGIDVIRVKASSPDQEEYNSALLMLAFLFDTGGKGYMDRCEELIIWQNSFLDDLEKRISTVTDKVSAVPSSTQGYFSTGTSEYTNVTAAAGATYPLEDYRDHASTSVAHNLTSGGTWFLAYDIDYIINIRASPTGYSWYGGTALDAAATIEAMFTQWSATECYSKNNVYLVCGDMPVILRIAYVAEILYPGLFENGYADALHLEFAKKFMGFSDSFMSGKKFAVSMADVGLP